MILRRLAANRPVLAGIVVLAALALAAGVALSLAGSPRAYPHDTQFLRSEPPPGVVHAGNELFPVASGSRWKMVVTEGANERMVETVSLGAVGGPGSHDFLLEAQQGGKAVQRLVCKVDDRGVSRVAIGVHGDTKLFPPMPLIQLPVREGQTTVWRGHLVYGKRSVPAEALIRVGGVDRVVTPAGAWPAYRIDLAIVARRGTTANLLRDAVWLAPGVGIVREDYRDRGQNVHCELQSYALAIP